MALSKIAKSMTLTTSEALFVQTVLRCIKEKAVLVETLAVLAKVDSKFFMDELAELEAKLHHDLFAEIEKE